MSEMAGGPEPATESSRYRVSLDIEVGLDASDQDDVEFDLDPAADLSVAYEKVVEELRPMTLYNLMLDWGMEPGRLMLTVHDTKTGQTKRADLYWEGAGWREH